MKEKTSESQFEVSDRQNTSESHSCVFCSTVEQHTSYMPEKLYFIGFFASYSAGQLAE